MIYLALLIAGAVLTGIHLVQTKGTSLLGWGVACVVAALLFKALS